MSGSDRFLDLSVIIVNWRSINYLKACLRSVYSNTEGIRYETPVVDNSSGDDRKGMLQQFPKVHLIQAEENLGFARANNLASSCSEAELLLFLNPDTEIIGSVLPRMVGYLRAHRG